MLVDGEDRSHKQNQKETVEHIMQHEKSAAGVVCQLKHHADLASSTNDVLGVVATLGKVNDDNVSRLLPFINHFDIHFIAIIVLPYGT